MTVNDIPLSAVFGLEPTSADDNTVTRESVRKLSGLVQKAVADAPFGAAAALRALDIGPGVVLDLARALRSPLSGIVAGAWNKRAEIRKYADLSLYPADATNNVWLCEHKLTQTVKPSVQVRYAGVNVMKLEFTGVATFTFHGATLVIRGGRITHLMIGDVTAAVEFKLEGAKLVDKTVKQWKIPGEVKLGDGVHIAA